MSLLPRACEIQEMKHSKHEVWYLVRVTDTTIVTSII